MPNRKALVAGIVGLLAAGGAAALAATGGSSHAGAASPAHFVPATVNVVTDDVGGQPTQILVDANGLPLYTYAGDTPTMSGVNGQLASLWPPLLSNAPTEYGTAGRLTVVNDTYGAHVQYDGHFLYTFLSDSSGHATGQAVQNFYVATPAGASSAPAAPSSGYAYRY